MKKLLFNVFLLPIAYLLPGFVGCRVERHTIVAEHRCALKLVNPSRRVISGHWESRCFCKYCKVVATDWFVMSEMVDMTEAVDFPRDTWEALEAGKVVYIEPGGENENLPTKP